MEKFNDLGLTVHGEIEFKGKVIRLTQDAYLDSDFSYGCERHVYRACGVDEEGNEYRIVWEPVENWRDFDDESECCNWDEPSEVTEI